MADPLPASDAPRPPGVASPPSDAGFRVIAGRLVVVGYEPDGDSVRFIADDTALLDGLPFREQMRSSDDHSVQLRLSGIDAPELHYAGRIQHLGGHARTRLMEHLGLRFTLDGPARIVTSHPASVRAVVISRSFDVHGRLLAHLLLDPVETVRERVAGGKLFDTLAHSVNARMVAEGQAYPLGYLTEPHEHRHYLRESAREARKARRGVWALDATHDFVLVDFSSITPPNGHLIFPKFFRRCVDCLDATHKPDLLGWLRANEEKNDHLLLHDDELRLSDILAVENGHIKLQADVLDLAFIGR
jgi:endonuclease YncB( thermonuclease family)